MAIERQREGEGEGEDEEPASVPIIQPLRIR
ncbi:hypothetical protein BH23THE1_BH23THE1_13070 [soil metagenome]